MNSADALAQIEDYIGRPTTQQVVWDSLSASQRQAILQIAGYQPVAAKAEAMPPDVFGACWAMLEKLARLALRIEAANERKRAELVACHNEKIAEAVMQAQVAA